MKFETPPPHGGRLVYNVVEDRDKAAKMVEGLPCVDIKPTLDPAGTPIRNVYREIMSIAYGFFSPLDRFMTRNEVERVLEERRLLDGWIFPYPIVLDLSDEDLKAPASRRGTASALGSRAGPSLLWRG